MPPAKSNLATSSAYGEAERLLDILEAFSTNILHGISVDDILWGVASQCIAHLGFEDCVIYLLDEKRGVLVQKAAYGPKNIDYRAIFDPIEIPVGQGVVGRVAKSGQPLLIDDLSEFEDYIVDDKVRRSELAVPILSDNRVIGVIDSEHSSPEFFQGLHLRTLVNIAHIAGHKIGRTRSEENSIELAQFYLLNPRPVLQLDPTGYVVHSNPVARDFFGPSAKPGQTIRIPGLSTAMAQAKHIGKPVTFQFSGPAGDDGLVRTFEIELVPLAKDKGFNAYGTEITAHIEARQLAEKANRSKSEFLSVMSHEIRTPLNAIIGLTDLLIHGELGDEDRNRHLQYMEFSGQHLLSLINDILDLEKITLGKANMVLSEFNIQTLFQQVIESFQNKADRSKISLDFKQQAVGSNIVEGDAKWITQILNNLLSNALKFTEQGGVKLELTSVAAEQVASTSGVPVLGLKPKADWIRLKVTDTGCGIAPQDIKRILKAFEQVDHPSNQRTGGTGLGLSITACLIDLYGGYMSIASEIGKGSSFTVDLPLHFIDTSTSVKDAPHVAAIPSIVPEDIGSGNPIILVDDNEVNRYVAEAMLKRWGYKVLSASGGLEAIELWKGNRPCLVLMDIHMPNMDGMAATRAIREVENLPSNKTKLSIARSPILALTADAEDITGKEIATAGMDGHILKPFKPAILKQAVEASLKKLHTA